MYNRRPLSKKWCHIRVTISISHFPSPAYQAKLFSRQLLFFSLPPLAVMQNRNKHWRFCSTNSNQVPQKIGCKKEMERWFIFCLEGGIASITWSMQQQGTRKSREGVLKWIYDTFAASAPSSSSPKGARHKMPKSPNILQKLSWLICKRTWVTYLPTFEFCWWISPFMA